MFGFVKV